MTPAIIDHDYDKSVTPCENPIFLTRKKMLENRPEDALGSLVKTVETERRILKCLTL